MELTLIKTSEGLKPANDQDYEKYLKLKNGNPYKCKVTKQRNYEFHKKYFALINCAWEYQNEKRQDFFNNSVEAFRKTVQIAAGHYNSVYSIERKEWIEESKSISFGSMDEFEFNQLYDSVANVLFSTFLTHISLEDFNRDLINF